MIRIKRVYDEYQISDGFRILVDRLWPRGISKEKSHIDLWLKEIAPSDVLRKWFSHDAKKWNEFTVRYKEELKEKSDILDQISRLDKDHKTVTLLYGAKDTQHNQAVVLLQIL